MPKHFRTEHTPEVVVPAQDKQVFDHIQCCLCDRITNNNAYGDDPVDWSRGGYSFDEIAVFRSSGSRYPEGGNKEVEAFHICPDCWDGKLKPWILSQGGSIERTESDW